MKILVYWQSVLAKPLKMKQKKNGGFRSMLLGTLVANIIRNVLAGRPKIPACGVIWAGEGVAWAGEGAIATSQEWGTIRTAQDL